MIKDNKNKDQAKGQHDEANHIEWKQIIIEGQPTKYEVSSTGLIRSFCGRKPRVIKGRVSYDGYHNAVLRVGGKPKTIKVHRLVAQAFIPNPKGLATVNHIDGDKMNNCISNLQWMSHDDNMRHAFATGLCNNRGESNGRAKLTLSKVIRIKKLLATGTPQKDIAEEFNVVVQTISKIKTGQCWSDVQATA